MRDALATGARFQNAKLDGVDMRGANFSSGQINADTVLDNIIADEKTDFEDLDVLRSTSRNPLFEAYRFDSGKLRKRLSPAVAKRDQIERSHTTTHSVSTRFSDGSGYAVPASDRIVYFDHNDPEHQRITDRLDNVIDELRTTNEHIENKESALQSMHYVKSLWERVAMSITMVRIGITMAIDDALILVGKATVALSISAVKTSIVEYIKKTFLS